jgi:OFA family oxalate/formate antiporter-like MFS transporter
LLESRSPEETRGRDAPQIDNRAPAKRGIFYGWYIVAAGFFANVAYSEQFSASYAVFIQHLGDSMGWSRTSLAGVKTVGRLTEAVIAPILGPLIDRYGARWLMAIGGVVSGLALMLAATVDELWQLYLFLGFMAPMGGVCLGGFVASVTVANWFIAKRGRAVGLVQMGISLGTTVLPLVASGLIEVWGWRGAWVALGAVNIALALPAAIVVRRRPEDLGLQPDGADPSQPMGSVGEPRRGAPLRENLAPDVVWTRRQVLRSGALWVMVFSWGFAQFAMASTTLHMVPFFQDLGYPLLIAAGALSLRSAIALVGNLVWGYALERLPLKPFASFQFLLTGLGLGMWLLPPSPASLLAGILFFGMGASGSQVVAEVMWAGFYGRLSLGTVRGVAYPIQTVFAAVGPFVVGLLYDMSGSYQSSFAIMVVGCVASAGLIQLARRPIPPAR